MSVVFAAAWPGCYAPLSTALTQQVASRGAGSVGGEMFVEFPSVDMLATVTEAPDPANPNAYPKSPIPTFSLQGSWGISTAVDLQIGAQGGFYSVIPVPHAGFGGVHVQVVRGETVGLGLTARAGYGGFLGSRDGDAVGSVFGLVGVAAQWKVTKWFEPGFAISAMPIRVMPMTEPQQLDDFNAGALTVTMTAPLYWRRRWFVPFVSAGAFTSDNVRGTAPTITAGIGLR